MNRRFAGLFLLVFICLAGLVRAAGDDDIRYQFAVVGDFQQPRGQDTYKPVSHEIVRHIAASPARFVVIVGDLVGGTGAARWREFDKLVAPIRAANKPLYAIVGNHDAKPRSNLAQWKKRFGELPRFVRQSGVVLVLLDSEAHADGYRDWELGDAQTRWLKNRPWVKPGTDPLVMFFLHRPIYRSEPMKFETSGKWGRDKPTIARLFERLGADVVFSGHEHIFEQRATDTTTFVITGGGGGSLLPTGRHHYVEVHVWPNKRRFKLKRINVR